MREKKRKMLAGAAALALCWAVSGPNLMDNAWATDAGEAKAQAQSTSDLVRKGQVLFAENCVACHQEEGVGKAGVAPSITNKELLRIASDQFLFETIRDGRVDTPMPAFGEVLASKDDIHALVAYLKSFRTGPDLSKDIEADHISMGDPRLGKRWFEQVCAGCHGPRGEGYAGEGSGTAIGKPGFLGKASDGFIRYIVKNGRSNTAMRGFSGSYGLANLSDGEIDDIISYLRILE
ncbi:MAG: c-type cytochrome [Magnetococcales bacterium]|nr:c-type cytochrome [Magnetococcales bacterium]